VSVYSTYVVLLSHSSTSRQCLLQSDATRPVRRKPVIIPVMSPMPGPLPTSDQHSFLRLLRKMFSSFPGTGMVHTDEPHNPLDVCFFDLFAFAVDSIVTFQFPATSPLSRPLNKQDGNVSVDFRYCISNLHSSSLDHLPPNPPSSIPPQPSNPAHIDYQLGGLFRHRQLSWMFLTLRVNWYVLLVFSSHSESHVFMNSGTLQQVLPVMMMI
jgi:hypothetical protein